MSRYIMLYIGLLYRYIVHCTLRTPLAPVVYRYSSGVVVAAYGLNERSPPLDSCDGVITFRIIGLEDERGRLGLRKKVCAVAAAEQCSSPRSCDYYKRVKRYTDITLYIMIWDISNNIGPAHVHITLCSMLFTERLSQPLTRYYMSCISASRFKKLRVHI